MPIPYLSDILEMARLALRRPDSFAYFGNLNESDGWGRAFGVHRDSDVLEVSNWSVISTDLATRFPDDWAVERSNHWAVGWVDEGRVRVLKDGAAEITEDNITDAFRAVQEWKEKLDNYPIANEEDYSQREWEEFCDYVESQSGWYWDRVRPNAEMPKRFSSEFVSNLREDYSRADDLTDDAMERAAKEVAREWDRLRAAFRFHFEHGGWIVGEKAKGALEAARAEIAFEDAESRELARIIWQDDSDCDASWLEQVGFERELAQWRSGDMSCEWARLETRKWDWQEKCYTDWDTVASLGGIFGADDAYRRVVNAELANEAGFGKGNH